MVSYPSPTPSIIQQVLLWYTNGKHVCKNTSMCRDFSNSLVCYCDTSGIEVVMSLLQCSCLQKAREHFYYNVSWFFVQCVGNNWQLSKTCVQTSGKHGTLCSLCLFTDRHHWAARDHSPPVVSYPSLQCSHLTSVAYPAVQGLTPPHLQLHLLCFLLPFMCHTLSYYWVLPSR